MRKICFILKSHWKFWNNPFTSIVYNTSIRFPSLLFAFPCLFSIEYFDSAANFSFFETFEIMGFDDYVCSFLGMERKDYSFEEFGLLFWTSFSEFFCYVCGFKTENRKKNLKTKIHEFFFSNNSRRRSGVVDEWWHYWFSQVEDH